MLRLALTLALTLPALSALADAKGPEFCPPGLAKKAVPCMPPGLAKQGQRLWQPGDLVDPAEPYHLILYPTRYGLPPLLPGERYIVIGGQILKVDEATWEVITLFQAIEILLD
jgi:hypothetical protein